MSNTATETKKHPQCHACGKVFDPAKRRANSEYNLTAAGPICCNGPECRGRVLTKSYEARNLKRWARRTQETLLAIMDVPPPAWDRKKAWVSVHDSQERIGAAIEFFSICWPVCLPFAVQTDADGEPIKERGEWKRHTHRSLAAVLHMSQPRVTDAIGYRKERHLLTELEDRLYPEPEPKLLNPQERDTCTRISDNGNQQLRALPPKIQKFLAHLRQTLPVDTYTRINTVAVDACKRLNDDISDARKRAVQTIVDACPEHATLLSRQEKRDSALRAGVSQLKEPSAEKETATARPPSTHSPDEQDRRRAAEYLYAEIPRMQDAFPNTEFAKSRFTLGKADRILVGHILDELKPTRYDVEGFQLFVVSKFKGLDQRTQTARLKPRSPADPDGPKSLGLLIEWARDYADAFCRRVTGAGN
jgi:hypothetical protein